MSGENGISSEYSDSLNDITEDGSSANGNASVNGAKGGDDRKVAVVTGATSGIGLALAQHLHHSQNYRIALVGRNFDKGAKISSSFSDPSSAQFFQCDVTSYQSQKEMFLSVWKTWGRIDLCCLTMGSAYDDCDYRKDGESAKTCQGKDVEDMPAEPQLNDTEVCCKEVIYGVTLAVHFMRFNPKDSPSGETHAPKGKIIVNASIGEVVPHHTYTEYCVVKAAMIQFVRGTAASCKQEKGVWLNCVSSESVAAPIMSDECVGAIGEECFTSSSTILAAHGVFINDQTGEVGKVLEALADKLCWYELPELSNVDGSLTSI
ncbi:hypothetical protein BST61_g2593 [Cercospora zeina]